MKRIVTILFFIFSFSLFSCSSEDDEVLAEDILLEKKEYFNAVVEGREYKITNSEYMGANISISPESGIVALGGGAHIYDTIKEIYAEMGFYVCFYDGEGTYTTGNNKDVSYGYFFDMSDGDWKDWWSDPGMGDPGEVKITYADEGFVEGTYITNAYSYEDPESSVHMDVEFGLKLEKENY